MKIKINHKTSYKYSTEVPKLIQCVKLYPTQCENQQIIEWEINCNSGKIVESHIDGLGHKILNIYNKNFSGKLEITSKGIVKTRDLSGIIKGLSEKVNPLCFLRNTNLTLPCRKIENLTKKIKKKNLIEFAHELNLSVSNSIKYVSGSTSTSTSSREAIEQGEGVCQDFAHILISAARLCGIPARYVNGFLYEDLNAAENSTHAWGELFLKEIGWVGFDPSHKKCVDDKYIRINSGFDFLDASIIKGIKLNYNGNESLESKVFIETCQ